MTTTEAESDLAANKDVAISWTRALFTGDGRRFNNLTHADFEAVMFGDLPMSGVRDLRAFVSLMSTLRAEHFAAGPFRMTIGSVTAEDDRVCLEAESYIPLQSGDVYNNHYVWIIVVRAGKVVRLKEIMDTRHVGDVLTGPLVDGRAEPRVNRLFDEPSYVIDGVMTAPGEASR